MSFFNRIKKFFETTVEKPEEKIENIKINQLPERISIELEGIKSKKDIIKNSFQSLISGFGVNITELINLLKNVDLSKRKEYENIKSIVNQNLNFYISYLEKLNTNLAGLNDEDFDSYIKRAVSIISDFNRTSYIPFERATILIGKELEKARKVINSFMKDVKSLIERQKPLTQKEELVKKIRQHYEKLNKIENLMHDSEKEIKGMIKNLDEKKIQHKETLEKITIFKESNKFKSGLANNEQKIIRIREAERDIQVIRREIDLKSLASIFHVDEKKARIIWQYANNFIKALKEDSELKFFDLLDMTHKEYCNKLIELREKLLQLENMPKTDAEITLSQMNGVLIKLESEITTIGLTIEQEIKKSEKINNKKGEIIKDMKSIGLILNMNLSE